jgi:PAS domain-containing protein
MLGATICVLVPPAYKTLQDARYPHRWGGPGSDGYRRHEKRNQERILAVDFTKSIIETMPEPVLVLNGNLNVLVANHSFYAACEAKPESTINHLVYELGDVSGTSPICRVPLEEVLPYDQDFLIMRSSTIFRRLAGNRSC